MAVILSQMTGGCDSGYQSVFDGQSLGGWECDPPELISHWKAEEGLLVGENTDMEGSILWTTRPYTDFEIDLEYRVLSDDYDSGIFIRGLSHQVQIGISRSLQEDLTACIYAPTDDRGKYPGKTDRVPEVHRPGEWNQLRVIATGKRIQTFLNDEPMVDYTGVVLEEEGPIGLQLHGGVHMAIQFRDVRIRELSGESSGK